MNHSPWPSLEVHAFLTAITGLLQPPPPPGSHGDNVILMGTGLSEDGHALIAYRERPDGPVVGVALDVESFRLLFDRTTTELGLARIVAFDEIADPSGPGSIRNGTWDATILGRDADIGWRVLTE